ATAVPVWDRNVKPSARSPSGPAQVFSFCSLWIIFYEMWPLPTRAGGVCRRPRGAGERPSESRVDGPGRPGARGRKVLESGLRRETRTDRRGNNQQLPGVSDLSSGASDGRSSRFPAFRALGRSFAMLPGAIRWRWAILAPIAFLRGTLEAVAAGAVFALIKIISEPPSIARLPVVSRVATMLPGHSAQAQIVGLTGLVALFYVVKNLFALGMEYFSHKVVG